ncbi:MAG: hypothetical protein RLZZ385_292 [Pseudomonadota bacterium]
MNPGNLLEQFMGAGALAYQAYQNWQQGKAVTGAPTVSAAAQPNVEPKFLPASAPAADGHLDGEEQRRVFEQVEKLGLDAQSKGFVFDALSQPADLNVIAASANGIEQASEIYLVSRLAIDPDHPAERAYLEALAHKLQLPPDLVAHLDHQVGDDA